MLRSRNYHNNLVSSTLGFIFDRNRQFNESKMELDLCHGVVNKCNSFFWDTMSLSRKQVSLKGHNENILNIEIFLNSF